jgi:hypothetical protein
MPVVKMKQEELNLVKQAAERKAQRTNSTFVVREERVDLYREKSPRTTDTSPGTKNRHHNR